MKTILALLSLLAVDAVAQNAPATIRNRYPNYWCSSLPQHVRHSPIAVPCPGRPEQQPVLQPSPNDPPVQVQQQLKDLGK
jgi:hypothetical protein